MLLVIPKKFTNWKNGAKGKMKILASAPDKLMENAGEILKLSMDSPKVQNTQLLRRKSVNMEIFLFLEDPQNKQIFG